MIELPDHDLKEVLRIVQHYAPECEVRAFGSRVNGHPRPYSDLDLVLVAPGGAMASQTMETIKDAFAESDLAIRVDVLDWHAISEGFRRVIDQRYEVVQQGSGR